MNFFSCVLFSIKFGQCRIRNAKSNDLQVQYNMKELYTRRNNNKTMLVSVSTCDGIRLTCAQEAAIKFT